MIIAGTGHRPNKLGGYSDEAYSKLVTIAHMYLCSSKEPTDMVISGMALGWDQALAEAARDLCVPYLAYVPFFGQESKWPQKSQDKYHALIRTAADIVVCNGGGYASWKMQVRNERMVNDANRIVALWDGSRGGTANCIRYAEKVGKPITNLWEMYET